MLWTDEGLPALTPQQRTNNRGRIRGWLRQLWRVFANATAITAIAIWLWFLITNIWEAFNAAS